MELQHNSEDEQTPSPDFVQGFNHGELLASLAPEVLEDISPVNNPQNDYYDGFYAAKIHVREEALQRQEVESLQTLRSQYRERENDLERE
jgi:hypothetical protein